MARATLPLHFRVLALMGAWCPLKKCIYRVYSLLVASPTGCVTISFAAKVLFDFKSFKEFINLSMALLLLGTGCVESGTYLLKRDKVKCVLGMMQMDRRLGRDGVERNTRKSYYAKCKKLAWKIDFFYQQVVQSLSTAPLGLGKQSRVLFHPLLLTYNLKNVTNYWMTYAIEYFTLFRVGSIGILGDLIATGFVWQLRGQLEALKCRLQTIPDQVFAESPHGKGTSSGHKRQLIKDLAEAITDAFSIYTVMEVYMDAMAICPIVYTLSTASLGYYATFAKIVYSSLLLARLFLNCYFGNEVAVQSVNLGDSIYLIDWTSLSLELRKDLSMMILRSSKPIMISSRAFIRLMLEFFIKIVKISSSGHNLLTTV